MWILTNLTDKTMVDLIHLGGPSSPEGYEHKSGWYFHSFWDVSIQFIKRIEI